MTKTLHRIGRHQVEVRDEQGNVIDSASGREAVLTLKARHGFTKQDVPPFDPEMVRDSFDSIASDAKRINSFPPEQFTREKVEEFVQSILTSISDINRHL